MLSKIRRHMSFANIVSVTALFVALGGTAAAAYVVNSNADIAPGTVSGHNPPTGDHANVITGSLAGKDLASQTVPQGKLKPAEAWHEIAAQSFAVANSQPNPAGYCAIAGVCVWTNYLDPNHNTAAFYRDPYGQVHLKGLVCRMAVSYSGAGCQAGKVTGGAVDDIFTLPAGYTPQKSIEFTTSSEGEFARLLIEANGTVSADPPFDYGSLYLDNIQFRCAPSGQDGCP